MYTFKCFPVQKLITISEMCKSITLITLKMDETNEVVYTRNDIIFISLHIYFILFFIQECTIEEDKNEKKVLLTHHKTKRVLK